jgi:carbonic anhydrase/acetyltransferase-like protein (isoleucine patch superfamily)
MFAMILPGGQSLRVSLHRARGVSIGRDVWISSNVILETEFPNLITIGDSAFIGIGVIVIAHFRESRRGVRIGKQAFIGPGLIILPNVEIGEGAVVTAGSVVTSSVPPMTVVQGNPAVPVAKCGVPLEPLTPLMEFSMRLKPLTSRLQSPKGQPEERANQNPERSECETSCPLRRRNAGPGCSDSPSCGVPWHTL